MALYHSSYTDRYGHTYNRSDGDINYTGFIAKSGVSVVTADNEADTDQITVLGDQTITSFADATYTGGDSKVMVLWDKKIVMGASTQDERVGIRAVEGEQIYLINCRIEYHSQDNDDKSDLFNSNSQDVEPTETPDRETDSDIGLINCTMVNFSNQRIEAGQGGGTPRFNIGEFTHSTFNLAVNNPDRMNLNAGNQVILDNLTIDWNLAGNNSFEGFLYAILVLATNPNSANNLTLIKNGIRINSADIFLGAGYSVQSATVHPSAPDGSAVLNAIISGSACGTFLSPSVEFREDGNIAWINTGVGRLITSQGYQPQAYTTGLLETGSDQIRYRFTTDVSYTSNGTNATITTATASEKLYTTDSDGIATAEGTFNWRNGVALSNGDTVETFEIPVAVAVDTAQYTHDNTFFNTSLETFSLFGTFSESLTFNGSDDATEAFNSDGSVDFITQTIVDSADTHMAKYSRTIADILSAVGTTTDVTLQEYYAGYKLAIYQGSLGVDDVVDPDGDGVWDITGETVNKLRVETASIVAADDEYATGFAINSTGDTLLVQAQALVAGTSTISRVVCSAFNTKDTTISVDITTDDWSNIKLDASDDAFTGCEPKGTLTLALTQDEDITFDDCTLGGLALVTTGDFTLTVRGAVESDFESVTKDAGGTITYVLPAATITIESASGVAGQFAVRRTTNTPTTTVTETATTSSAISQEFANDDDNDYLIYWKRENTSSVGYSYTITAFNPTDYTNDTTITLTDTAIATVLFSTSEYTGASFTVASDDTGILISLTDATAIGTNLTGARTQGFLIGVTETDTYRDVMAAQEKTADMINPGFNSTSVDDDVRFDAEDGSTQQNLIAISGIDSAQIESLTGTAIPAVIIFSNPAGATIDDIEAGAERALNNNEKVNNIENGAGYLVSEDSSILPKGDDYDADTDYTNNLT